MQIVRVIVVGLALLATATAVAASGPTIPPGGPAPKALIGTWTTTLSAADVANAPLPSHMPSTRRWVLLIRNTGVGKWPRLLGLRPVGEGSSSFPFGVQRNLIHVECLNPDTDLATTGHDTLRWSIQGKLLRLRIVRQACKTAGDRNDRFVLTSEPWKRAGT